MNNHKEDSPSQSGQNIVTALKSSCSAGRFAEILRDLYIGMTIPEV